MIDPFVERDYTAMSLAIYFFAKLDRLSLSTGIVSDYGNPKKCQLLKMVGSVGGMMYNMILCVGIGFAAFDVL
ncbi:MAG: hypothetical protein LBT03_01300 [Holosporales bacterium]|jgi:hypothetical protein|nr:hypothetical protein [Holosporales bacterium]